MEGDQEIPEAVGVALDLAESLSGQVLLKTQVVYFRVASADVRIEIDISSVNRTLPVRLIVDAGNPVTVAFPAPDVHLTPPSP